MGKKRIELYLDDKEQLSETEYNSFIHCLEKRSSRMPIAYITGNIEFMSLPFIITPGVFIPRPETEILVETALSKIGRGPREVIDMCTGSGNIAVSLAKYSSCHIHACDISPEAIEIAIANAKLNGVSEAISFYTGDMFNPFKNGESFDLIVSNPPYVHHDEMQELPEEVYNFEPHIALDGGDNGLDFYHSLCNGGKSLLKTGGYLITEVGFDQAEKVCSIFKNYFASTEIITDYAEIERIVVAQKRSET